MAEGLPASGRLGRVTIAALFVETRGVYSGLNDVEVWDEERDARLYAGPHPVVAHPPCQRWGRYWFGGPSAKVRRVKGDDGGCFAAALAAVREFGGVLEHPEGSAAWDAFGLMKPPHSGGWVVADWLGGWTCCVEQGHYGHRARKKTWLYANGVSLPSLRWGPSEGVRLDEGFHSSAERRAARAAGVAPCARLTTAQNLATPPLPRRASRTGIVQLMSKNQRAATPPQFRDLLLTISRTPCPVTKSPTALKAIPSLGKISTSNPTDAG